MKHEIQALRAFAVLAVIAYHFWPTLLSGGFAGVDVFFVISGFLISGQILGQIETGTFSFAKFYVRRIRRIFPAALLVLLACLAGIVLISSQINWQNFAAQTSASALFFENWFLGILSVDYLGASADPSPVQHYWSLSVEEQFYLVWPLLIVVLSWFVAKRRSRNASLFLALSIGGVFLASLGFSILSAHNDPIPGFYNTFGRIWEFALGALLAISLKRFAVRPSLRMEAALLGWFLLIATVFAMNSSMPFPGYVALMPAVGTVLVIAAGSPAPQTRWSPLYANRFVLFVAAVSFSAYLWHWPLLIFGQELLGAPPTTPIRIFLLVLTFGLAFVTTKYVENPVRFGKKPLWAARRIILVGVASIVLIASVSAIPWIAIEQDPALGAAPPENALAANPNLCVGAQAMDAQSKCQDGPYPTIVPDLLANRGPISPLAAGTPQCAATSRDSEFFTCNFGDSHSATRVALVGDSHAMKMFSAIESLAKKNDWSMTVFLRGSCAWNAQTTDDVPCQYFRTEVSKRLQASRWSAIFVAGTDAAAQPEETYNQIWQPVLDGGSPIVVIRDNPRFVDDPRVCSLAAKSAEDLAQCSQERTTSLGMDAQADAVKRNPGTYLVDLTDYYCSPTVCPAMIGGIYVYRDRQHINDEYAVTLAPYIQRQLMGVLPNIFVPTH